MATYTGVLFMDIITTENGIIDHDFYYNASMDIIRREADNRGIDLSRVTTNQLKSLFRSCYNTLFKPNKKLPNNAASIIPYNTDNITTLLNIYIDISEYYNCMPSLFGFERYSGITEDTTQGYVTAARLELIKQRKTYIQNRLTESPVGSIALANNDIDTGLMYNRQNIIDTQTVKQGITLNDFVKIAQKE